MGGERAEVARVGLGGRKDWGMGAGERQPSNEPSSESDSIIGMFGGGGIECS